MIALLTVWEFFIGFGISFSIISMVLLFLNKKSSKEKKIIFLLSLIIFSLALLYLFIKDDSGFSFNGAILTLIASALTALSFGISLFRKSKTD